MKKHWKILTVFAVPLFLALPFPPPPIHVSEIKVELYGGEPAKQEKFKFLTGGNTIGASFFSAISGIKTYSMPGYICLSNTSEITAEGESKKQSELLDSEGGSITVPVFFDETALQIIVPFASTKCVSVSAGIAELGNDVKVRGFLPFSKAEVTITSDEEAVVSVKQYQDLTTIFKMEGKKGYSWQWKIFILNYLLLLAGWTIFLSSFIQVYYWIFSKPILKRESS